MKQDKSHVSVAEIKIQQEILEQKIKESIERYLNETGLYPSVEITKKTRKIFNGTDVHEISISVTQVIDF